MRFADQTAVRFYTPLRLGWLVLALASMGLTSNLPGQSQEPIQFSRDVLPVLSDTCFTCHGPDAETREADLRFDLEHEAKADRDGYPAIVPMKPDESELVRRIFSDDEGEIMPPPEFRRRLTDAEKQTLKKWIAEGAEWEQHWAFVKPERPKLPTIKKDDWLKNEIDHFVLARLENAGMTPATEAPKEKLIRRVTLDLTGLPPTPQEVDAFLKNESPNAYEQLVDRLIASPRYGERMAMPWLEAARFADTDGYQFDGPRYMWRWRDWVIDAYNQNMPFNQFTIEQLAGDLLPDPTLEQKIATGFNRNHRYNSESGLVVDEYLLENAVDRVDTTSTVWLGLTVGCARCHDHKYDPISQKDYYQLIAFFNNVPEAGRAIKAGNSEPYVVAPTKPQQVKLAKLDRAVASAKAALDTPAMKLAQRKWEAGVAAGKTRAGAIRLRGLAEHYPMDGKLPDDSAIQVGKEQFESGLLDQALTFDGQTILALNNTQTEGEKKTKSRFTALGCTDKFSLSFWLLPNQVDQGVIVSRQESGMGRKGSSLELREGHLVFKVISRWIAGAGVVETRQKLQPNRWVHVAISNDGSQRATEQKIYINGKRADVRVILNTNSNTGGAKKGDPLRIGGGPHGANFSGAIDDVHFYKRELWADEVTALSEKNTIKRIVRIPPPDRNESQRTKIRVWFQEHGPNKKLMAGYRNAVAARDAYVKKLPTSMVMRENREEKETFLRVRGVYNNLGEKVERAVPSVLPTMPANYPRNRLGLARWIVSKNNPLTARVTVNRYWQKYFGIGLVKTSEDFGIQGEKPSHPDLLDWLATHFVDNGWNVAGMQKLIVMSSTYRQASNMTNEMLMADPNNRMLARGPRVRLPGPVLRDQALFAGGLLVEKIGGPSVSPYQPSNLWIEMSMGRRYKQSTGDDLFRRSLYTVWKRTVNPPSMAILDAADRESCWVGFKRTNTPLQALTLLNETAFVESARHLGQRMIQEGENDPIGFGFRIVTSTSPSAAERAILQSALDEFIAEYKSDKESAKKLSGTGTTPVPKDVNVVELAAYTALANVLLNLDEVITNE